MAQASELTILWSEVVSPLADAVGLVDRHKADLTGREQRQKHVAAFADEPFWRHIQEAVTSLTESSDDARFLIGRQ